MHCTFAELSFACCPLRRFFQPCCFIPCNTPAPPVVSFALIPTGGRILLPQGIIQPGRRAGPAPSRPAGRTRPSGPGPLYTVHRDHGGHGALDVTGGRSPDGHVRSSPGREGTYRSGRTRWRRLCGRRRLVRDCPPRPARGRVWGRVARAGARRGRDRPTRVPDGGGSPSPKATVYGPSGHSRCTRASGPGFDGGRARSGARSTASVFCAGVLCGPCVAPLLPGGPASLAARARSSRGAATVHRRGPAGRAY